MGAAAIIAKAAKGAGKSKAFQHLGKIKSSQWKEMGRAFKEMTEFSKQGGVARFIGGTIETIKTKIQNQVIGMFSPVINEITQFTADLLEEAGPITTALGNFIGLLKDLKIQIGDTNVSLLDLLLGFPLFIKGLNAIFDLFTHPAAMTPEDMSGASQMFEDWLAGAYAPHGGYQGGTGGGYRPSTGGGSNIGSGSNMWGSGGYQEF